MNATILDEGFVLRPEARLTISYIKDSLPSVKIFPSVIHRISEPETHLLGWNVPPDELASIPEHWLSYKEPNASMHYLLGTVYIAFMFVALIGNGLVLWVFTSYVFRQKYPFRPNCSSEYFPFQREIVAHSIKCVCNKFGIL